MEILYSPCGVSRPRRGFPHFSQMARPAVSLQLRHLKLSFGWGKLRTERNSKTSAISDFETIHPSNNFFHSWLGPGIDFLRPWRETSRAELAWAGPSQPEPARGAIGWIFSDFGGKYFWKKDFGRFWKDFGRFCLPNPQPEPASPPKPIDFYWNFLDFP